MEAFSDDSDVQVVQLSCGKLRAFITNYGATLVSLQFEDEELVLGFEKLEDYRRDQNPYFGATVGRVGNRIANGEFRLNDRTYPLAKNHAGLCLHGGVSNFSRRVWRFGTVTKEKAAFELFSADGDEGFPGSLCIQVEYELMEDNRLSITYRAQLESSKENERQLRTIVNMTNHSYFNLNGVQSGADVRNHILHVPNQSSVLELNQQLVPTGNHLHLDRNPSIDFRTAKRLGDGIDDGSADLYDCNLVLDHAGDGCSFGIEGASKCQLAGELASPATGIRMQMWTTEPGFQLYTGKYIDVDRFKAYSGVALEAQRFPNACNIPKWQRQTVLAPGQEYRQKTVYGFDRPANAS